MRPLASATANPLNPLGTARVAEFLVFATTGAGVADGGGAYEP